MEHLGGGRLICVRSGQHNVGATGHVARRAAHRGCRTGLAHWRFQAGDPADAADAYEHLLVDFMRVLGPDHPDTLTTRNNLTGAYHSAGRVGEAITLYEQTLTDYRRVLGDDHPSALAARNNLAGAYQSAGRLGEAITLLRQVAIDFERTLGPEHQVTLPARANLAAVLAQEARRLSICAPPAASRSATQHPVQHL